jgi:hypothetical protein
MPQGYTDRVLYLERAGKALKAAEIELVKQASALHGHIHKPALDHYNAAVDQALPMFKAFFEGDGGYLNTPGVAPQIPEYPVRFTVDELAGLQGAEDALIPVSRITAFRPTLGNAYSIDTFAGNAATTPAASPDDPTLAGGVVLVIVIGVAVLLFALAVTWAIHEWQQPKVLEQLAAAKATAVRGQQTLVVQEAFTKLATDCGARGSTAAEYGLCMERGAGAIVKMADSIIDLPPLTPADAPRRWLWVIVGIGLSALLVGGVIYYRRKRAQRREEDAAEEDVAPPAPVDDVMDEVY